MKAWGPTWPCTPQSKDKKLWSTANCMRPLIPGLNSRTQTPRPRPPNLFPQPFHTKAPQKPFYPEPETFNPKTPRALRACSSPVKPYNDLIKPGCLFSCSSLNITQPPKPPAVMMCEASAFSPGGGDLGLGFRASGLWGSGVALHSTACLERREHSLPECRL